MAREDEVKVGVAVRFRFGLEPRDGVVKEDRGGIGRGGRRLYLIEFNPELDPGSLIELPAERFELLGPRFNSTDHAINSAS